MDKGIKAPISKEWPDEKGTENCKFGGTTEKDTITKTDPTVG